MTLEGGPYIQVAAFCDYVLEDKQGVLSLIRMIDTLTHTERGPQAPKDMPPVAYNMKLVVCIKAGRARGRGEVRVVPEEPSGESKTPMALTVHLEGDDRGHNLVFDLNYSFTLEGLYWFNVYFDEALLTRVPFRVKYMRMP